MMLFLCDLIDKCRSLRVNLGHKARSDNQGIISWIYQKFSKTNPKIIIYHEGKLE